MVQANETHTTGILTSVFPFLFSSFSKIRPLFPRLKFKKINTFFLIVLIKNKTWKSIFLTKIILFPWFTFTFYFLASSYVYTLILSTEEILKSLNTQKRLLDIQPCPEGLLSVFWLYRDLCLSLSLFCNSVTETNVNLVMANAEQESLAKKVPCQV